MTARAGTGPLRVAVSVDAADAAAIVAGFAGALPGTEVQDGRDAPPGADYVVVGVRDATLFDRQRAMKAVFAFGAGVNGVLALPGLPPQVPVIRLEDAGMAAQMARYVVARRCARSAASTSTRASSARANGGSIRRGRRPKCAWASSGSA